MKNKKIISLCISIFMAFGAVFAVTSCGEKRADVNDVQEVLSVQNVESRGMKIKKLGGPKLFTYNGDEITPSSDIDGEVIPEDIYHPLYLEQTLTATITPDSVPAEDKKVDWALEVVGEQPTGEISDYIILVTASDGANVVSVQCLKPFDCQFRIVCTARKGGFRATCLVRYDGKPTGLKFGYNGSFYDSSNYLTLNTGSHQLTLDLYNVLGVGSNYLNPQFEVTEITGIGAFKCAEKSLNYSAQTSTVVREFNIPMSECIQALEVSSSISGDKLTVSVPYAVESFYAVYDETDGYSRPVNTVASGTIFEYVGTAPEGSGVSVPKVCIKVKDKVSGVTGQVYIKISCSVTGIELSETEIVF